MIRLYKHETDFQAVKNYCYKHNIAFPDRNLTLIVSIETIREGLEPDKFVVNGLVGLKSEVYVEPLIADNPILANNLGRMIEGIVIQTGIAVICASVPRENVKHINQLEKDGFVIIDDNHIKLEKKYG